MFGILNHDSRIGNRQFAKLGRDIKLITKHIDVFLSKSMTEDRDQSCSSYLENCVAPEMSGNSPGMRQTAKSRVTQNVVGTKCFPRGEIVDIQLDAILMATEQRAPWESRYLPPNVDCGSGNSCSLFLTSWTIPQKAFLETMQACTAFKIFEGFSTASRVHAWLRRWQIVTSDRPIPLLLPRARTPGNSSLCHFCCDHGVVTNNLHPHMGFQQAICLYSTMTICYFFGILPTHGGHGQWLLLFNI